MRTILIQLLVAMLLIAQSFTCYAQNELRNKVNQYLENYYQSTTDAKVYVHTDKYLYENGENIWLTALAVNRFTHQPLKHNVNIGIELFNSDGISVWNKRISIKQGKAKETIPVFSHFQEGTYTLKAFYANTTKVLFQQDLLIQEHVIPYHLVNVSFQDKFYGGGEKININCTATDYFKNPLKRANYEFLLMNGDKIAYADKGRLDKIGNTSLEFDLPNPISDDGLTFTLTVEDKNVPEIIEGNIPTKSEKINVFFFPEGGSLIQGLKNKMTIKAYGPNGDDFPFSGVVFNEDQEKIKEISSDDKGVGTFTFTPGERHKNLKLQINSPYVVNKIFSIPTPTSKGAGLSIVNREENQIELKVSQMPQQKQTYYLGVIHKGKMLEAQKFTLADEKDQSLTLSKPGINKLTLFNEAMVPISEIMTYVPENEKDIKAAFNADTYKNREKVTFNVKSDASLNYAFSAVDEYRYRIIPRVHSPNILSHLEVNTELNGQAAIDHETFNRPEELAGETNNLLSYASSADTWKNIYAYNNENISFLENIEASKLMQSDARMNYQWENQGHLVIANFTDDVYYLASNPILVDKLNEEKEVEQRKPYYIRQLESGTPLKRVIHNMKPYEVMGDKIVFMGSRNSLMNQGGALIVIDGINMGESMSALDQISPFMVEDISISTKPGDIHRYTGLNSVGVIEIDTKKGEKPSDKGESKFDDEFESPDHSKNKNIDTDLRTTIFYSPFKYEETFPDSITFYHSDIRTNVVGRVEGVDENGNVFYKEASYKSFNYSKENQ